MSTRPLPAPTAFGGISLDVKLGFRMLVKYPGLTIVGGVAMAFAIWIAAVTFEVGTMLINPALPLPDGDRIVQLRNWDAQAGRREPKVLHDYTIWRQTVRSVTDIGAFRDESFNVIGPDGDARQETIAAITASGFRIASGTPLIGRTLIAADEDPSAPAVIVLGYDIWRTRFGSDTGIVGRSVQLGETYATVVGVMREGFAFPIAHQLWMPLRLEGLERAPRMGPELTVFGRLAPGASIATAQAELTVIGKRAAVDFPDAYTHIRPRVTPYTSVFREPNASDMQILIAINLFVISLLVLLASNVALLLFARAATRENELIVRSALGASRMRIIVQLVAEALVLGTFASAIGLGAAALAMDGWVPAFLEINMGTLPFWFDFHLSLTTICYAVGLTVLGAIVAGALPALKVTRGLGARLKEGSAGAGGLKFGGVWTAVIVAQVAITVAFPAAVFFEQHELRRVESFDVGFRSQEYLSLRLDVEIVPGTSPADTTAQLVRFAASAEALRQRVAAEPGVAGVTFADALPRMDHHQRLIEVDGPSGISRFSASDSTSPFVANLAWIDPSYFQVLDAPIVSGRAFSAADAIGPVSVAIVDEGFVERVMNGRNPIGQRVRYAAYDGEQLPESERQWVEIIGVTRDLGMGFMLDRQRAAGLYFPSAVSRAPWVNMIVHAQGDPLALAPKVRALASSSDGRLRLSGFQRLDKVAETQLWLIGLWLKITTVLTAIAILVSLAGIYAVLSFTVARRTREIGVRVALGASPRRLIGAIFRRPLTQIAMGVGAGGTLVGVLTLMIAASPNSSDAGMAGAVRDISVGQVALLLAYAALMFGVCLLACVVPTKRALGVQPTEALRAE